MSAGVSDHQRMKGQGSQVSNGPKEHVTEHEDFDSWRNQHHQGYNPPMSSSAMAGVAADPYMSSYYAGTSFPYQTFGVGDGTWSNGDPMTFLSGYGGQMAAAAAAAAGHDSYNLDGMFGGGGGAFGGFANQPGFNYGFHGNGDYSTWGAGSAGSGMAAAAAAATRKQYDDYYRGGDMYGTDDRSGIKAVEQSMQGLGLDSGGKVGKGDELGKDVGMGVGGMGHPHHPGSKMDCGVVGGNAVSSAAKKMTWASIASQPAKPQPVLKKKGGVGGGSSGVGGSGVGMPPPPMIPGKHNLDIGTWEAKNGTTGIGSSGPKAVGPPPAPRPAWGGARGRVSGAPGNVGANAGVPPPLPLGGGGGGGPHHPGIGNPHHPHPHAHLAAAAMGPPHHHPHHLQAAGSAVGGLIPTNVGQVPQQHVQQIPASPLAASHPVLDELRVRNMYNPGEFDVNPKNARFFVIKSYSEDDIHRSIKYEIWCSTEHGNKRLDTAFRDREAKGGVIYLFFSVNGSGHFCGMAQMMSPVDYDSNSSVWSQDKWKGQFRVKWVYVKDVPNAQLRHIRLENNENKPVTNSRDTQEVPYEKGRQVLRIMHQFRHSTSIFDDFIHYEKRQEEEDQRKHHVGPQGGGSGHPVSPNGSGGQSGSGAGTGTGERQGGPSKDREGGRGRGRSGRN